MLKKRTNIGLLIILTVILPGVTIYALMEKDIPKSKDPGTLAENYLVKAPTYNFDGIPGSIIITGVHKARTPVPTWLVTSSFRCEHPGYGDRTGKELEHAVTGHSAYLIVQEGEVVSALIDGEWDELNQEYVSRNHVMEYDVEEKDSITDKALEFIAASPTFSWDGIEETVIVEDVVLLDTYPVQYRVTLSFNSSHAGYGNRTGTDIAAVITPHTAIILLEKGEVVTALLDDTWDIISQRTIQKTSLSEIARDLVIEYILENHLDLGNISRPEQWVIDFERHETRLEGGEITGYTCLQYHSGCWTMKIGYKTINDHTYDVEVLYQGEIWFTWKGQIDPDDVTELAFESA